MIPMGHYENRIMITKNLLEGNFRIQVILDFKISFFIDALIWSAESAI